jgi:EF hand
LSYCKYLIDTLIKHETNKQCIAMLLRVYDRATEENSPLTLSRRSAVFTLVLGAICVRYTEVLAEGRRDPLHGLDTDNDKTIDLAEVKKAASTLFDRLEKDQDGTLDRKELRGRLSEKELLEGDPDKDKSLTKDEFLAVVEQRFKAADKDADGTLDLDELRSPAGKALLKLLQ